jgi:hypothetical protein
MKHNYTRQRQGRDFSLLAELRNCDPKPGIPQSGVLQGEKDDTERKRSLLAHLDECVAEADRNATPIDGREPALERGL